jgi:hypothetical protein
MPLEDDMFKMGTRIGCLSAVILLIWVLMMPVGLAAQGTTATILGTVTDSTGGAIAEAMVTVTNVGTGSTQSVVSDALGRYTVPNLGIGDYEVSVSKAGFSTVVRKSINLTVGSQNVIDVALPVGAQTQLVTVEAAAVQVETTSSTLSTLVDTRQMRDLPLNGRNFEQLVALTPGVASYAQTAVNARQGASAEAAFGGPGARTQGQEIRLDDEDIQNFYRRGAGTVTGSSLGVEATAEFQVLTNSYSSQFGGSGIVVNSVTKSGTNSLHGSAYEYLRNSAMDARNFFDGPVIPNFRKNQYGGSLGGPIIKDKLFFFGNYEGIQQALGQSRLATVPDAAHRSFTAGVVDPAVQQRIVDTLALFPLPTSNFNAANGTGQITTVATSNAGENFGLGRLDYNMSSKDSIFLRYLVDRQSITQPFGVSNTSSLIPLWPEQDNGHTQFLTIEWKRILNNNLINTGRFSFGRTGVKSIEGPTTPTPVLQFWPESSGRTVGRVSITGLTNLGLSTFVPATQALNRFAGAEDLLWTHGAHTIRFGGSVTRQDSNIFYPFQNGGVWSFNSLALFQAGTVASLTGVPLGPQFIANRGYREIDFATYVQDDWKITRQLNLNLGVRYDPQTNPVDVANRLYNVPDFTTATGFTNVPHITEKNPNTYNISPRIGFAWDMFADHKTSLRGGFAKNIVPINPGDYTSATSTAVPWNQFRQTTGAVYGVMTGLAAAVPSWSPGWNYHNNKAPMYLMANLSLQRELAKGTIVTVGYVWTHGLYLQTSQDQNPTTEVFDANGVPHFAFLMCGTAVCANPKDPAAKLIGNPRANPNLANFPEATGIAASVYNALQVNVNRRFSGFFSVQGGYVYSVCRDDGGNYLGLNYSGGGAFQNPYNPKADWGSCTFDIRHNFHINGIFAPPFKGNRLIEGWQLTPILSVSTGLPLTPTVGFDITCGSNNTCTSRPDLAANCSLYANQSFNQWFNPACYSVPAPGLFGNLPRQSLVGPNLRTLDLSLLKDTALRENFRIQFRAEAFNILNRTNLGGPSTGLYSAGAVAGTGNSLATAGQITSTVTTARQLQMSVKVVF